MDKTYTLKELADLDPGTTKKKYKKGTGKKFDGKILILTSPLNNIL